ncbi:hypothetical protein Droror1_Dr00025372 [Drosera rotundifolia]
MCCKEEPLLVKLMMDESVTTTLNLPVEVQASFERLAHSFFLTASPRLPSQDFSKPSIHFALSQPSNLSPRHHRLRRRRASHSFFDFPREENRSSYGLSSSLNSTRQKEFGNSVQEIKQETRQIRYNKNLSEMIHKNGAHLDDSDVFRSVSAIRKSYASKLEQKQGYSKLSSGWLTLIYLLAGAVLMSRLWISCSFGFVAVVELQSSLWPWIFFRKGIAIVTICSFSCIAFSISSMTDGRFDDEYFKESEQSSQFRHEYEMRKIKQDQGLDVISEGLDTLKDMAQDMNEEFDKQVPLLDEIDEKVDRATNDL